MTNKQQAKTAYEGFINALPNLSMSEVEEKSFNWLKEMSLGQFADEFKAVILDPNTSQTVGILIHVGYRYLLTRIQELEKK